MNPRCGIYASLGNTDATLTGHPERIAKLARWDDVILDLGPAVEQPQIIAALRQANPEIRIHSYVVMKAYNWPGAFFQELNGTIASIGGYLYAKDGEMWRDSNINLARGGVVRAVARVIAKYLTPEWAGLFLDVCPPLMQNANASGVNWQRAGFDSEADFMDAWAMGHAALMQYIRHEMQNPALVIVNNPPFSHADANGQMRESFPNLHVREPQSTYGNGWAQNMIENGFDQPGVLREVYREPRASWLCSAPVMGPPAGRYDPNHHENLRRHRYGLASACLGGAFHSFGRYESDPVWCVDRLNFWYPEYSHPQRGKGWLGLPLQDAEHVIHEHGKVVDLWERKFEHGYVVVNPSAQPHSIYFEERYQPIGGTAKTAFSVPPHDALIMEAV